MRNTTALVLCASIVCTTETWAADLAASSRDLPPEVGTGAYVGGALMMTAGALLYAFSGLLAVGGTCSERDKQALCSGGDPIVLMLALYSAAGGNALLAAGPVIFRRPFRFNAIWWAGLVGATTVTAVWTTSKYIGNRRLSEGLVIGALSASALAYVVTALAPTSSRPNTSKEESMQLGYAPISSHGSSVGHGLVLSATF